jgi:hypothetical protein
MVLIYFSFLCEGNHDDNYEKYLKHLHAPIFLMKSKEEITFKETSGKIQVKYLAGKNKTSLIVKI